MPEREPAGNETRIHAAILKRAYLDLVLLGAKTIECRLTRTRCEPFGRVHSGERIYFKESSGPFRACAIADRVHSYEDLSPADVRDLRARFEPRVLGGEAYWRDKETARYATIIELARVEMIRFGPTVPTAHGRAWFALDASACVYPDCLDQHVRSVQGDSIPWH